MPGTRLWLRGTYAWNKAGVKRDRCLSKVGFFDFAFLTFRLFRLFLMFCKYKYIYI